MQDTGKTMIVTGAASGIGRGVAEKFAAAGARVLAVDRDAAGLDAFAAEVPGLTTVVADISSPSEIERVMEIAGPRVDVLVNNAAIMDRMLLVDEIELDLWERIFAINVTAPYLFCHHAVPLMIANGGGVIINVSSAAGIRGGRAGAAYSASKHAVIGLTKNIAATLGHEGIRAIPVCPGTTRGGSRGAQEAGTEESPRGAARIRGRDNLPPEPGTADQLANVIVFLASDGASRMNGHEVVVDGGALTY